MLSQLQVDGWAISNSWCDAHGREDLMEEINVLHEKFENQGTKRTYRSGSQAYDVTSATIACFLTAFMC